MELQCAVLSFDARGAAMDSFHSSMRFVMDRGRRRETVQWDSRYVTLCARGPFASSAVGKFNFWSSLVSSRFKVHRTSSSKYNIWK